MLRSKLISGLIQIDKPVYHPGDTVKFRVIVLDNELKPPATVKSVHVTVQDPQKNVVRKWASAKLHVGVFESDLQIAPSPLLGTWKTVVMAEGEELVSKTFEVKEYVLSTFDLQIAPSVVPLEEHQALNLTIAATYHFGKPVQGLAKIELYLGDDKLNQTKEIQIFGRGQVELRFADFLPVYNDHQDVRVKVTFIEQFTNRSVIKNEKIKVFQFPYRVELVKHNPKFRPGHTFKCALKFTYHDGTPAAGITGKVEINDVDLNSLACISDSNGLIELELETSDEIQTIDVIFFNEDMVPVFHETIDKMDTKFIKPVTNGYIKLQLKSPAKLNSNLRFTVTCKEEITFFVYYVMSKGKIVDAGYMRPNRQTKFQFTLNATEQMIPKAQIIVVSVASHTVVYDFVGIDFQQHMNYFNLNIDEHGTIPGKQIELNISGRPGTYIGLAAYDKGLLLHSKNQDLFWEDIAKKFDGFQAFDEDEYDEFQELGVFCLTLPGISMTYDKWYRSGRHKRSTMYNPGLRRHFLQSWLWKNVSIGNSGSIKLIENVPDTITSWYLTGFSIDPVYGLGIIKKPIELTTVQPFYIVDNLPYSIKRGEAVELPFTLFNNFGTDHIADVTLYNVANQMEFIGRPRQALSYSKSVSVPPNVGIVVSFLVKARKLGEIVVRVKASIADRQETDELVKLIRVMPESIVQETIDSRFFCHDKYTIESFWMSLDIDKKADQGSVRIEFRLTPYLQIPLIPNLLTKNLLGVKSIFEGRNFVGLYVLDYMTSTQCNDTNIIEKATRHLQLGYRNQMRYRLIDGSFGVWPDGSSVLLIAFVVQCMQTAAKYLAEVDGAILDSAFDWLVSKQHSSGCFDEVGSILHEELLGRSHNAVALTSFVLIAFLENNKAAAKQKEVVDRGMKYLSKKLYEINSAYDLSVVTYAMMLNGHSKKSEALVMLMGMSSKNKIGMYWNTSQSVETTAYALLSIATVGICKEGLQIMRWLVNERTENGIFPDTQHTLVDLKALSRFTEKITPYKNDYEVWLHWKKSKKTFKVHEKEGTNNFTEFPKDTKQVKITVLGRGFGILEMVSVYNMDMRNFNHRYNLKLFNQNTGSDYKLRMRVCVNFIPRLFGFLSNMTLIEVNFPSGYVVDQNPISEQTTVKPIQNIEILYGGTSVVIYYDNMGEESNCFTVTAYRRFKVALRRPAYVIVYDYYNPNLNAIKVYEVDKQNVCEICDPDDCPSECKK